MFKQSLVCLVVVAGIASAADGVAFTSPDGKFKADFPAQPKESEQKVQTGAMKLFAVMQGSTNFTIAVMPIPNVANATPEDLEKILDNVRDGLVNNLKAKVLSNEKIQLDKKYPGRDVVVELPGGVQLRNRVFLVESTLYQVMVAGPGADALKSKDATTFLNSFKLAK